MAGHIPQTYYLTGTGDKIYIANKFIYELTVYRITKNSAELLGNKFYSSNSALNIKKHILIKKYKDYKIIKSIDWLSAPEEFIHDNNFRLYDVKRKKITKNERKNIKSKRKLR